MKYLSKASIPNILILISVLFFLFGCSGTKPATKPTSLVEPATKQAKKEEPPAKPTAKPVTVSPAKPLPPPSPAPPKVIPAPPLRVTKVVWAHVNLREGPGTSYKVIGNVKKGTPLTILEVSGDWFCVRLESGSKAWVTKLATSEASKSPPPVAISLKPTPM